MLGRLAQSSAARGGGLLLLLCWAACAGPPGGADAAAAQPSRLWQVERFAGAWTYRLGPSPRLPSGGWLWAQPDLADGDWPRPARVGQAPVEYGQREMWMRVRLDGPVLQAPTLFLPLAGHAAAYLDGQPVALEELPHHAWEELRSHDRRFLLHLAPGYKGRLLALHLQSSAPRIGVLSTPYLGEPMGVLAQLLRNAAYLIVVTVLTAFLAIAALALFLVIRQQVLLLYFSLACVAICLYFAGLSGLLGWLFRPPPPSNVLYNLAAPLAIASVQAFIIRVLRASHFSRLYASVFALLACSLIELIAISLHGVQVLDRMIRPVNVIVLLSFTLVIYHLARSARDGDIDARIMSLGILLASFLIVPDILTLAGIWIRSTQYVLLQIGCSVFLLSLGMVPVRRFMETHRQLSRLTQLQAAQVEMLERRNAEIQSLNDELRRQIEQRSDRMLDLLTRSSSGGRGRPAPELAAGASLGDHYRVIRPLGRGAMGSVYEVERTTDGQHLAAKLLISHAERSAMLRFVREARILAQLQHPNLVSITDIDISADGALFLVMELVRGSTLRDARQRFRDLAFARAVLRQICLGLQAIHDSGFVHRDLKPANVLLTETAGGPVAKIADFGISTLGRPDGEPPGGAPEAQPARMPPEIAALLAPAEGGADNDDAPTADAQAMAADAPEIVGLISAEALTRTGAILGTPLYMAPELATGSRKAAPPSDVFSLGVIAFELVTGELPFKVPPVVAVWQRRPLVPPPLKTVRADLPDALADLLDRCLAGDPATRPTLPELIAALAA